MIDLLGKKGGGKKKQAAPEAFGRFDDSSTASSSSSLPDDTSSTAGGSTRVRRVRRARKKLESSTLTGTTSSSSDGGKRRGGRGRVEGGLASCGGLIGAAVPVLIYPFFFPRGSLTFVFFLNSFHFFYLQLQAKGQEVAPVARQGAEKCVSAEVCGNKDACVEPVSRLRASHLTLILAPCLPFYSAFQL